MLQVILHALPGALMPPADAKGGRLPESGASLCSQSTVSRLENQHKKTIIYR